MRRLLIEKPGWMGIAVIILAVSSGIAFPQEKTPPEVTEKGRLFLPESVNWQLCSPEGAKPEERCEFFVVSGDPPKGASGMYVRLPRRCRHANHWHTSPMHLVGIKGEFIYMFEDGTETSLTPGAYVFMPGGKVHSERCGDAEDAVFYVYFEQTFDQYSVTE